MRTIKELLAENISRENMTKEEALLFVNYWFNEYESEGFAETFCSPYSDASVYNGKKFNVVGRVKSVDEDVNGADLECLPMWTIKFEDGYTTDVYPEEIIPSEIENWRKLKIEIA